MKYERAGDPITGLLWTRKTRKKICECFKKEHGIKIGKTTVGKYLKKKRYSLKCNSKKISNGGKKLTKKQKKDRNTQFKYIEKMRREYEAKGLPVISVDTKKKEPIGNFKNPGTRYKKEKDLVYDHDFLNYAIGKAYPYVILDDNRNEGFVYVGKSLWDKKLKKFRSSDTPEFAAENVGRWWKDYGSQRYPSAKEILILADSGGSNSNTAYMWKFKLYEEMCKKHGLKVTVCHYPAGASKWNPVEHRLNNRISENWKGTPLCSFETVVKYIRTTTTETGLTVKAKIVTKEYKTGKSVNKEEFNSINLEPNKIFPKRNYTLMKE